VYFSLVFLSVPAVLLVADFSIFACLAKGVGSFMHWKTWYGLVRSFQLGVSWVRIQEFALETAQLRIEMSHYPSIERELPSLSLFEKEDWFTLLARLEKAANAAEIQERKERRLQNRRKCVIKEETALLEEAVQMGISEPEMRSALDQGLGAARTLIEQHKFRAALRQKAERMGCMTLFESALKRGDAEASGVLAFAESLINRSVPLGCEGGVREAIRSGDMASAESVVQQAEKAAADRTTLETLRARVRRAPKRERSRLSTLLHALEECTPGKKEFRKAAYELEKALAQTTETTGR
jgi:hypothetical protein